MPESTPEEALDEVNRVSRKIDKARVSGDKIRHYQTVMELPTIEIKELRDTNAKFEAK
jgi:hypothetical protein